MNETAETLPAPDTKGIRVTLTRVPHKGMGHPSWTLPLSGGSIEIPADELPPPGELPPYPSGAVKRHYIEIEVEPETGELPQGQRASYDELVALAAQAEKNGGYLRHGDGIRIGDVALVGRDAVEFLVISLRRSQEREAALLGNKGWEDRGIKQAREDTHRTVKLAVEKALTATKPT